MQTREKNPLLVAINDNQAEKVEALLKDKLVIEYRDFNYLKCDNISQEILDLLAKYHALPKDLSMSTFKFHLYLRGNPNISESEFIDEPDLNLGKCAGFVSPMQLFAQRGHIAGVKWLMSKNIQERPIDLLIGIHDSHFLINIWDTEESKKKLSSLTSDRKIINKCKIIELFLKHPTDDLEKEINDESSIHYKESIFLPFFAWTAANNRADLFDNEDFKKLIHKYPNARNQAVQIAVIFGAADYIKKIIASLDAGAIREVLIAAVACHNQTLLENITQTLGESGISLKDIFYKKIENEKYSQSSPLFWAIRLRNLEAVNYFLNNEINPNIYQGGMTRDSYLHLAVRGKNLQIVEALLEHDADLNHKDFSKQTPLHQACELEQWDIAKLLIRNHASLSALDDQNKSPLDYVKDENIKKQLTDLIEDLPKESVAKMPLPFFKRKESSVSSLERSDKQNKLGVR